jgi:transposase-like protein
MTKRRNFTQDHKNTILKEAATNGVAETAKKYGMAQSLLYRWKSLAEKGSKPKEVPSEPRDFGKMLTDAMDRNPEMKKLQEENRLLREIVARSLDVVDLYKLMQEKN